MVTKSFKMAFNVYDVKLSRTCLMSNLGSGPCISDKLFVSEPLFAILAELEVEAGHEGAKHTTTLSQHTYRGAER